MDWRKKSRSITDAQIVTRRGAIGIAAGGIAAALAGAAPAQAQFTDRDPTDPVGRGRGGGGPRGVTDADPTDPPGRGRGSSGRPRTGYTDTDRGPGADPAGHGRGTTWQRSASDRDPTDPPGQGRRQVAGQCRRVTGRTDNDGFRMHSRPWKLDREGCGVR